MVQNTRTVMVHVCLTHLKCFAPIVDSSFEDNILFK